MVYSWLIESIKHLRERNEDGRLVDGSEVVPEGLGHVRKSMGTQNSMLLLIVIISDIYFNVKIMSLLQ